MCDFDLLVNPAMREAGRIIEDSGFRFDIDDGEEKSMHEIRRYRPSRRPIGRMKT